MFNTLEISDDQSDRIASVGLIEEKLITPAGLSIFTAISPLANISDKNVSSSFWETLIKSHNRWTLIEV